MALNPILDTAARQTPSRTLPLRQAEEGARNPFLAGELQTFGAAESAQGFAKLLGAFAAPEPAIRPARTKRETSDRQAAPEAQPDHKDAALTAKENKAAADIEEAAQRSAQASDKAASEKDKAAATQEEASGKADSQPANADEAEHAALATEDLEAQPAKAEGAATDAAADAAAAILAAQAATEAAAKIFAAHHAAKLDAAKQEAAASADEAALNAAPIKSGLANAAAEAAAKDLTQEQKQNQFRQQQSAPQGAATAGTTVLPVAAHPTKTHEASLTDDRYALSTTERAELRTATTPADVDAHAPAAGSTLSNPAVSPAQSALQMLARLSASHTKPETVTGQAGVGAASAAASHNGAANFNALAQAGAALNSDPAVMTKEASRTQKPLLEQISLHIQRQAKGGIDEMSFKLNPIELGKLEVKLEFASDKSVQHIRIIADTAQALDALQRDQKQLERTLQDAGVRAEGGSLEFSLREQSQQQAEGKPMPYARQAARLAARAEEMSLALASGVAAALSQDVPPGRIDGRI